MAKLLLPDALLEKAQPLLPKRKPRRFRYPGRKPIDDRRTLEPVIDLSLGVD